jgi:hypothetical protein
VPEGERNRKTAFEVLLQVLQQRRIPVTRCTIKYFLLARHQAEIKQKKKEKDTENQTHQQTGKENGSREGYATVQNLRTAQQRYT